MKQKSTAFSTIVCSRPLTHLPPGRKGNPSMSGSDGHCWRTLDAAKKLEDIFDILIHLNFATELYCISGGKAESGETEPPGRKKGEVLRRLRTGSQLHPDGYGPSACGWFYVMLRPDA